MANLQKALDALKPYVIGIRYVESSVVVDAVFKDGWVVPESNVITKTRGSDEFNYYMLYSTHDSIGVDELLAFVDTTIKTNIEREKKHELLKERVNELKELFKKNSFTKIKKLKFVFAEEDLIPEIGELDDNVDDIPTIEEKLEPEIKEPINEEPKQEQNYDGLTEEDIEVLEEEKRFENFKKQQQLKSRTQEQKRISTKVELPPKKISDVINDNVECDCGPDEACAKCIDKKDL